MTAPHTRLDNVYFEHSIWLNELVFYIREISLYESEVRKYQKYFEPEAIPEAIIEAGNEIKIFRDMAHDLINQINAHVSNIQQMIKSNGHLDQITDSVHPRVRLQMAVLRKDYTEWKEKFHQLSSAILQEKKDQNP